MSTQNKKINKESLDDINEMFNKSIGITEAFQVQFKDCYNDKAKVISNLHKTKKLYKYCRKQREGNYDFDSYSDKLRNYANAQEAKQEYDTIKSAELEYEIKKAIADNKSIFYNFDITFPINTAEDLKGLEEKIKTWRKQFKEKTTDTQNSQDIKDENLKLNLNNLIDIVQSINPDIALSDFDDWLIRMSDNGFIGNVNTQPELSDETEKIKNRAAYIKNIFFNYCQLKTNDQSLTLKDIIKHLEAVKKVSSKFGIPLKDVLNLKDVNDLCFSKLKVDEIDTSELIEFVAQNEIFPSESGFYDFERLLRLNWQTKGDRDKCNFAFACTGETKNKNENTNDKYVNSDGEVLLDKVMTDLENVLASWDKHMFQNKNFLSFAKKYETENRSAIESFEEGLLGYFANRFGIYVNIEQGDSSWQIKKIGWHCRNADKPVVVFNYESVKKYCISKGENGIAEFVKYKTDSAKSKLPNEYNFIDLFTAVFSKSSEANQKNFLFDEFEKCLDGGLKSNGNANEALSSFCDHVILDLILKEADERTKNAVREWCNSFTSYSKESQQNILIMLKDIVNGNWQTDMIKTSTILTELQQSKAREPDENIEQSQVPSADNPTVQKPEENNTELPQGKVKKPDENIEQSQVPSADNPTVQKKSKDLIYVSRGNSNDFDQAAYQIASDVYNKMKSNSDFSNFVEKELQLKKEDLEPFINDINKTLSSLESKQKNILNENSTGFKVIIARLLFVYFNIQKIYQSPEVVTENDLNGLKQDMKQVTGELCQLGIINAKKEQDIDSEIDTAYSLTTLERILGKLIRFVGKVWLYFASESKQSEAKSWAEYSNEKMILNKVFHSQIYKDNNSNKNTHSFHHFSVLKEKLDEIPKKEQNINNRDK